LLQLRLFLDCMQTGVLSLPCNTLLQIIEAPAGSIASTLFDLYTLCGPVSSTSCISRIFSLHVFLRWPETNHSAHKPLLSTSAVLRRLDIHYHYSSGLDLIHLTYTLNSRCTRLIYNLNARTSISLYWSTSSSKLGIGWPSAS
jgi:hypothetical protein